MVTDNVFYHRSEVTIFCGDCLNVMPTIPSESMDFVLTDPPYLVGFKGRWDSDKTQIVGDTDPSWVRPAFGEVYRLMKPDTFCVSFYGWPHSDIFLGAWKSIGFRPVSHLAFIKPQWGLGRFTRGKHETAFLLAKGRPPIPRKPLPDVVEWHREPHMLHPNQKPISALAPLLSTYCPFDGIVFDPFMGSGSTLRAAKDLGLNAVGIEIDPWYCRRAVKRMAQGVLFPKMKLDDAKTGLLWKDPVA